MQTTLAPQVVRVPGVYLDHAVDHHGIDRGRRQVAAVDGFVVYFRRGNPEPQCTCGEDSCVHVAAYRSSR